MREGLQWECWGILVMNIQSNERASGLFSNLQFRLSSVLLFAPVQARKIVSLLGCKSSEDLLVVANELGFAEVDFLYSYEPTPGELEDFYNFLGLSKTITDDPGIRPVEQHFPP